MLCLQLAGRRERVFGKNWLWCLSPRTLCFMPLVWESTRGSCSSAWATMSCTCGAGSPTPSRCSRWKPRPGRRSTRSNWKGGFGHRQLMWHGRNKWHPSARVQQAAGQGSVTWVRLWAVPGSGGAHVALELWRTGRDLGCPAVGLCHSSCLALEPTQSAVLAAAPGLQGKVHLKAQQTPVWWWAPREGFSWLLSTPFMCWTRRWLGVRGSLHRGHICVPCRHRRNWEICYRQGKRNSNSTTGCRLLIIQEITLLFSRTCGLFVSIPSALLFSHLLDFPNGRSNKVTPPLPCSTSVVFPLQWCLAAIWYSKFLWQPTKIQVLSWNEVSKTEQKFWRDEGMAYFCLLAPDSWQPLSHWAAWRDSQPAFLSGSTSVWKWASSMKCVSNRKQLEDEKRRRETIEREKEQMLREKEELLVRLQEYEVKTQKAEKGKVLVLADQTMYCAP